MKEWFDTPIEELQLDLEDAVETGYERPEEDRAPESSGDIHYTVNRQVIASHDPRPCAVILRDGISFGYIPCDTEEEFEWLKTKLTGTRPRS